jgi:hypothetical protein
MPPIAVLVKFPAYPLEDSRNWTVSVHDGSNGIGGGRMIRMSKLTDYAIVLLAHLARST